MSASAVRPIAISSVAILGLFLGGAQPAESQSGRHSRLSSEGPVLERTGQEDWTCTAQLFTSYDDDVLADQRRRGVDGPTSSVGASGIYSGLSAALQYAHVGKSTDIRGYSNTSVNYYPDLAHATTTYHQAGATVISRFGRRYTFRASPFAAYSPQYSMRLFLAPLPVNFDSAGSLDGPALAAPDVDSTILQRESFRYGGNAELRILAARHSTVTIGYDYTKTDLTGDFTGDRTGNFDVQSVGAMLSHQVVAVLVAENGILASAEHVRGFDKRR